MPLREKLFEHPDAFFAGCLVWVPIAVWVVSFINWMIQGDLDVLFGLTGISIALALGVATMNPPKEEYAPLMFAGVLVTVVTFPFLRAALNKRALAMVDFEAMQKSYEMLEAKPDNLGARIKLAKIVYMRGMMGHATAIAEAAVQGLPRHAFAEEIRMAQTWKRLTPPDAYRPLPCVECGHMNPPGLIHCAQCGSRFLLDVARGRWVGSSLARKLVAVWGVMIIVLVGIPVASSTLPPALVATAVVSLLAAVAWVLLAAFRGSRDEATA